MTPSGVAPGGGSADDPPYYGPLADVPAGAARGATPSDDVRPEDLGPADVVQPSGLRHAVRAFRHRDYTTFWLGALASNTGTWIQNLTVPYVLYEVTNSALWLGLATFAQFAPSMLLAPVAGAIADRFDHRRALLAVQGAQALAAVGLCAAWAGGLRSPVAILGLVAVLGVFQGLNIPSWQSFLHDLVPRQDLLSAITLNSVQVHAARAIGPGIAGLLLATVGATWAFVVNVGSFVFVLLALLLIRTRSPARTSVPSGGVLGQFARALRYVRGQQGILTGIFVSVLVGGLGNPIFQFIVIFSADVFLVGPLGLASLNIALGVGAVVAAPLVSGWDNVFSRATLVRWALLGYGMAMMVFAVSPTYPMALVTLVVVGAGFLAVVSIVNTSVQSVVADHMRGRVLGLRAALFTGAYPLGALGQGWLSDQVGPRFTVLGAGALLAVAALWLGWRSTLLSRLDDPHDNAVAADGA